MLVFIGLFSMFLLIAGIVMLVWFGPVGMFVFAPGVFMLISVTIALFLEVRIRESNRLKRADQEHRQRVERLTELKKASELREKARASYQVPKPVVIERPAAIVKEIAETPPVNAEKTRPEKFETRLIAALSTIDLSALTAECGIKIHQPSRVDFSAARNRSAAPGGNPAVRVSFELSRKWLNRLPLRQRQDLLLKLMEAVSNNLFSADEAESHLLGERVGPVCISGWAKIKRTGAPTAVRVSRECLISISGPAKHWRSFGTEVCRSPEGPHPSPGLFVKWAGGHPVEACEVAGAGKDDTAFLHKDFSSI